MDAEGLYAGRSVDAKGVAAQVGCSLFTGLALKCEFSRGRLLALRIGILCNHLCDQFVVIIILHNDNA